MAVSLIIKLSNTTIILIPKLGGMCWLEEFHECTPAAGRPYLQFVYEADSILEGTPPTSCPHGSHPHSLNEHAGDQNMQITALRKD